MGYKIFTYEIRSSYAARIDNYRSYDAISKDIIQRWTYPLVPDVQFFRNSATKLERQGMYRASGNDQLDPCLNIITIVRLDHLLAIYEQYLFCLCYRESMILANIL